MSDRSNTSTAGDHITIVAAGDVEWSGTWVDDSPEEIFLDPGATPRAQGGWQAIPRLISAAMTGSLKERAPEVWQRYEESVARDRRAREAQTGVTEEVAKAIWCDRKTHDRRFASEHEWATHPFKQIRDVFRTADVSLINLETPLSDRAPRVGAFLTPTRFVDGLKDAGISVVSLANNHMLDAQLWGLYDTLDALENAGIQAIGAGRDLTQARRPYIVEKRGVRVAFLAYTQSENSGRTGFALSSRGGVAPLDPLLIEADINQVRGDVDHVVLSFHWDLFQFDRSKSFELHPDAIAFAHHVIDSGADAILGHHAHVPRAVEYYKDRPILYSMGHLIFSYGVPAWVDNFVARLVLTKKAIPRVEILPTAGRFEELGAPFFLSGERAAAMLTHLKELSVGLGGALTIDGDRGVLTP